jgi:FKBP-type peptidyl-prolyl cis-trans isomerase
MHEAKLGDRVRIEYSRVPKPGAIIATSRPPKVLEFTVGSGDIIPSVSLGVVGMAQGDHKRLAFQPETENGIVPAGLSKQTLRQRSKRQFSLRVRKTQAGADAGAVPPQPPKNAESTAGPVVVELDVMLISLDSSASANKQMPQFEMGGES